MKKMTQDVDRAVERLSHAVATTSLQPEHPLKEDLECVLDSLQFTRTLLETATELLRVAPTVRHAGDYQQSYMWHLRRNEYLRSIDDVK